MLARPGVERWAATHVDGVGQVRHDHGVHPGGRRVQLRVHGDAVRARRHRHRGGNRARGAAAAVGICCLSGAAMAEGEAAAAATGAAAGAGTWGSYAPGRDGVGVSSSSLS